MLEQESKRYTRSQRKDSEHKLHKSAITDHAVKLNHVIDWDSAKALDTEDAHPIRKIREAINIRKLRNHTMNRDEGAYHLPDVYNSILPTERTSVGGLKNHSV